MKKIFFGFMCCLCLCSAKGQSAAEDTVNRIVFLLPEFVKGKLLFKTGTTQEVLLNYNTLFNQMIFEKNGVKMALDQISTVDTVYIDAMKFVPADTCFYSIRLEQTKLPLYIKYSCTVEKTGSLTPFGSNTQTGAVQNISSYRFGVATPYQLRVPDTYTVNNYQQYYIQAGNKFIRLKNRKQVAQLFPHHKTQIDEFIKDNHIEFNNIPDIEKLVLFIGTIEKNK